MEWKYWRVVLKYGHVGKGNEVSVARYLVTNKAYTLIMVMEEAAHMPGVKQNGVLSVRPIDRETFLNGKRAEQENFFLNKMKTLHKKESA